MNSKIIWCLKKRKGVKIVEPNDNLTNEYIRSCNEDLNNVYKVSGKWESITSYYACYNALYALLCKIGIKSEIHDCTIALMPILGYSKKYIDFISNLKKERIDVQYYLKKPVPIDIEKIKQFILESKKLLAEMNDLKINEVRNKIKNLVTYKK